MGVRPRTFPGGINKWQWKRLHEKKTKEKEKRLLLQEKQLYQARLRSQIRAKNMAGELSSEQVSCYGPTSPKEHVKALADRFMLNGAEDLWNENDGPLRSPCPKGRILARPQFNQQTRLTRLTDQSRMQLEHEPQGNRLLGSKGSLENGKLRLLGFDATKPRSYSIYLSNSSQTFGNKYGVWTGSSAQNCTGSGAANQHLHCIVTRESTFCSPENFSKHYSSRAARRWRTPSENENDSSDDGYPELFRNNSVNNLGLKSDNLWSHESRLEHMIHSEKEHVIYKKKSMCPIDESCSEGENDPNNCTWKSGRSLGLGGRGTLGKHDRIFTKRVPLAAVEMEINPRMEVELIREELEKRQLSREVENHASCDDELFLCKKRFDECSISPLTIKALANSGYIQMTRVQEAVLSICLDGRDALVKARSQTAKSMAFLIPAVETVLKAMNETINPYLHPIYVLIICPTRELASQVTAQANALLKYHTALGALPLVGSTRFKDDQLRLQSDHCQIIVATPGRLLDHIETRGGLSARLMALKMLVIDEADHLLDLGFRADIERIVDCVPRQRQSMVFAATVPREVRRLSQLLLRREHAWIDTLCLDSIETPSKIKQSFLVAPHETNFPVVYHLLKEHIQASPDYKVIIFCTTRKVASLMFLLLREMGMNVRETHPRKPRFFQIRMVDEFRGSKRQVLVTSDDCSGMNCPGVTLVIQVGIPYSRELYIHRLGRTGDKGRDGEGVLLIAPWEEFFLEELKDLPLERLPLPRIDPETEAKVRNFLSKLGTSVRESTYHEWLGYYNSIREIGRDKTTLVELAKQFAESICLKDPPPLFGKQAIKMGLKGIPGIRVQKA